MLTVNIRNETFDSVVTGHLYVASGMIFVWNNKDLITVRLDAITNAYMHPLDGLILDIK